MLNNFPILSVNNNKIKINEFNQESSILGLKNGSTKLPCSISVTGRSVFQDQGYLTL